MNDTRQQTTIAGVFDRYSEAQAAARELTDSGIPKEEVCVRSNLATGAAGGAADAGSTVEAHEEGGVRGFFRRLFGQEEDASQYSEAVRRGSTVVVVTAPAGRVEEAAAVMNRHGAIDIDRRVADYREMGWRGYDEKAPAYTADEAARERERYRSSAQEGQTIPVVDEEMVIGKRVVRRGGVRVYTEIVEEPVEKEVSLREEHARVQRRAVDREISPSEASQLRDQSIEVTETAEEPVISKRARVKEEVVVGKEVTSRTEKVTDKLRHTNVKVEKLGESGKQEPPESERK